MYRGISLGITLLVVCSVANSATLTNKELVDYLSYSVRTAGGEVSETKLDENDVATLMESGRFMSDSDRGHDPDPNHAVFGKYERGQIKDTTSFPHRVFGQIQVGCSGTLIGPRQVLTAGHCVYDTETDEWHTELTFSPGRNGASLPYGKIKWEKAYAVKGWTKHHSSDFDFAMIVLSEAVGDKTGWLALATDASLQLGKLTVEGYPGDKPLGTLWSASCPLTSVYDSELRYLCDTYGGNSGSSITAMGDEDAPVVYGVHTRGMRTYNAGTRLTAAIYHSLMNWKSDH